MLIPHDLKMKIFYFFIILHDTAILYEPRFVYGVGLHNIYALSKTKTLSLIIDLLENLYGEFIYEEKS